MNKKSFLWVVFVIFVTLPWIELFGAHILMFNFYDNRFEFGFYAVEANVHQLIAGFALMLILALICVCISLSYKWCGSFCPTTLFLHIFEDTKRAIAARLAFSLVLSALFSFSLIGYFVPSQSLLKQIFSGESSMGVWFFYIAVLLTFALTLALKRWYCSYLCIYGAFVCKIFSASKKNSKISVAISILVVAVGFVFIFDKNNLDYCNLKNKELHYGR